MIKLVDFNPLCISIAFLPISLVFGSFVINLSIILINILFIFEIIKKKISKEIFYNIYFLLFFILFLYLLFNLISSVNLSNSLSRTLGFIRFILLVFALKYFIENKNFFLLKKKIFNFWLLFFSLITFDIFFEYFLGFNMLGFSSDFPGRIASFLGNELKIGNFYYGFALISITTIILYLKNENNYLIISLLFLLIITSFIIGERSNFLRCFFAVITFILFYFNKSFIKKLIPFIILLILTLTIIINFNKNYKARFVDSFIDPIHERSVTELFKKSVYGSHYNTAYNIFLDYPFLGVGLKNFRIKSGEKKYENTEFLFYKSRQTTHPHQIHLEILSELGLVGYLIFCIFFIVSFFKFFKIYCKHKSLYSLSGAITVFFFLTPVIPTGSFFTTYSATIFWIAYAFMVSKNN